MLVYQRVDHIVLSSINPSETGVIFAIFTKSASELWPYLSLDPNVGPSLAYHLDQFDRDLTVLPQWQIWQPYCDTWYLFSIQKTNTSSPHAQWLNHSSSRTLRRRQRPQPWPSWPRQGQSRDWSRWPSRGDRAP